MLIDSHVHLDDPRYNTDREAVLQRAQDAGIEACITIGCDLATSRAAAALAEAHHGVFASVGIHPHESGNAEAGWEAEAEALARRPRVVACGETGLDYHYDHAPRDIQRRCFREHIRLARAVNLPLVIHTRDAQEDTVAILREEGAAQVGGVFHCFSGDARFAKDALDLGFSLSFSGMLTFANAATLRDIAKTVPLDRLMIETDCPYLAPVPHRGTRNEPAYVRYVAHMLAEVAGHGPQAFDTIAQATVRNTQRVFSLAAVT